MSKVMKHIGFGSILTFKNLYSEVKKNTNVDERLAYANYDPSLGEPPTEQQSELLASYTTTLPTLEFRGSEKLHGENMAVGYSQGELWVQGRNSIRTVLSDQNGMAKFVDSKISIFKSMLNNLSSEYNINTNKYTILIDGEWAGGNIQKGNSACSGTPKAFYIFDYFRIVNNETGAMEYLKTENLILGNAENIHLLQNFAKYEITLDFNEVEECELKLKELAEFIEDNSAIAKYFNKPDNVGEGVCFWSTYKGKMLRLKTKGLKHGGKKKSYKNYEKLTSEDNKYLIDLAHKLTPTWRINQGITETGVTEVKYVAKLIKWVHKDIVKEEFSVLLDDKVKQKVLNRLITTIVKDYFFTHLQ